MEHTPSLEECIRADCMTIRALFDEAGSEFIQQRVKKEIVHSSVFIYELLYAIEAFTALAKVDARNPEKPVYAGYAVEKLKIAKSYVDCALEYFQTVLKETAVTPPKED